MEMLIAALLVAVLAVALVLHDRYQERRARHTRH